MTGRARRWYGASPLHLLALLAAFALTGYAVRGVIAAGQWGGFALWFGAAIVGHDLLLFPLYSLADLSLRRLLPGASRGSRRALGGLTGPPAINYVRVPAAFSLLLLLVWFPLILGLSARTYHRASGLVTSPYLGRWLAVTGVLFALSAASYALALRRQTAGSSRHRHRHFHRAAISVYSPKRDRRNLLLKCDRSENRFRTRHSSAIQRKRRSHQSQVTGSARSLISPGHSLVAAYRCLISTVRQTRTKRIK